MFQITRGKFGKTGAEGSNSWLYSWLLPFGPPLASNTLVGLIVRSGEFTPGFPAFWELMLFYTTPSHIARIVLAILYGMSGTGDGSKGVRGH